MRILPALRAERAAGRMPQGAVVAVAAWIAHLRGSGAAVGDAQADRWAPLAQGETTDGDPAAAVAAVFAALAPDLADDADLTAAVRAVVADFENR